MAKGTMGERNPLTSLGFATALISLVFVARHPWQALKNDRKAVGIRLGQARLRRRGVTDWFDERPRGTIPPEWHDLWNLYQVTRTRKPKVIVEMGSGCSTPVIALAVRDNFNETGERSDFYSLESDRSWMEVTESYIPDHLKDFVHLQYSDQTLEEFDGGKGAAHTAFPNVVPNFLYVDGCSIFPDHRGVVEPLMLEDKLPNDFFMLIDGGARVVDFLKPRLKRKYQFRIDRVNWRRSFELIE